MIAATAITAAAVWFGFLDLHFVDGALQTEGHWLLGPLETIRQLNPTFESWTSVEGFAFGTISGTLTGFVHTGLEYAAEYGLGLNRKTAH